ncbi:hypothetical protein ACFX2J_014385 [Malus domestica]
MRPNSSHSPISSRATPRGQVPRSCTRLGFLRGLNFPGKPVKVYLYDLPKRFTYRVIKHHSLARDGRPDDDVLKLKYPGHQHMGEWYLFQDLLKPDSERVGSPVENVLDPEEADLFYVPFFSSLSLIVNQARPASGSEKPLYSDEENQVALIEWLEAQEYWKKNNGRDHVIMASDPNALYKVIDRVKNCVLLVELKLIDNKLRRQVMFSKRRSELIKKAHKLSVLGGVELGLVILSAKERLYEFCSGKSEMFGMLIRFDGTDPFRPHCPSRLSNPCSPPSDLNRVIFSET